MNSKADKLWGQLQQAGVVSGSIPASTEIHTPWYVRVMLGVSGWIAAVFLLGFVAAGLHFVIESKLAASTVGLLALMVAYTIFRSARNDFYEQFGLAVSFVGQALILYGFVESVGWRGSGLWWVTATLQVLIAMVMPNFIQRLVAGYLAAFSLSLALTFHGAPFFVSVLVTFTIAIVWLNEFHWQRWGAMLRPVGYGLTLALLQWKGQLLFGDSMVLLMDQPEQLQSIAPTWVGELATGMLLIVVVGRLMSRGGESWTSRRMLVALLVASLLATVSLEAPGIATGFTIILLGFSNTNRVLIGLGIAALLLYISAYYYTLHATLLTKAEILAATGATLLLARWAVLKWIFTPQESSHA